MSAHPPSPIRRVALVGIDGSGKSTLARLLAGGPSGEQAGEGRAVLSCLRAHENPDGPLHRLSRHLDLLSREADRLGGPDLKLAVLYLQMCTYAVTERFFTGELGARVVISERHPVIDGLAYLPLYRRAIAGVAGPDRPEQVRKQLAGLDQEAVAAALAWCETLGRRLGRVPDLATVAGELVALLDLPPGDRATALAARLGTPLPDIAVFLDIDVAEALRRVRARDGAPELHERHGSLARIREGYEAALAALGPVRVHRIAAGGASPAELRAELDALIPG
ncbi:thymidylate kinase [Thermocatellispora tengchongensis]|uniref:Thymidylate kinase n=1 Tax=Thermocatellispora tengchongensis TaxID=1073253 RepID=A0A840P896_9ACTN|nr:hypothetical protein [Thermocatellispora tengchongensis]MBB5135512.1 thymidylate kinase [Thermocatellispora tengchongensis]